MSDSPRRAPLAPLRARVDEAKTDNKNYRHKQRDLITKTNLHPKLLLQLMLKIPLFGRCIQAPARCLALHVKSGPRFRKPTLFQSISERLHLKTHIHRTGGIGELSDANHVSTRFGKAAYTLKRYVA